MPREQIDSDRNTWTRLPKSKTTSFELAHYMVECGWIKTEDEIFVVLTEEQEKNRQEIIASPQQETQSNWSKLPSPPFSKKLF